MAKVEYFYFTKFHKKPSCHHYNGPSPPEIIMLRKNEGTLLQLLLTLHVFNFLGLHPRHSPGFCPWSPLGDFRSTDHLFCPSSKQIPGYAPDPAKWLHQLYSCFRLRTRSQSEPNTKFCLELTAKTVIQETIVLNAYVFKCRIKEIFCFVRIRYIHMCTARGVYRVALAPNPPPFEGEKKSVY